MVSSRTALDLRAERAKLEEEIARLRARVRVAEKRVVRAAVHGPSPRGFWLGVLLGGVFVAGAAYVILSAVKSVLGHD
jgi:hypothetical protein